MGSPSFVNAFRSDHPLYHCRRTGGHLQTTSMAALELRGAALPPVCIPSRAQNSKPCPKQDSAVEHAIDGSIPYMEDRDQRSTLLAQESTYRPIAAATPRAAAEGPVGGAMSEDSSQHGAAGEASLSHHLGDHHLGDRTPTRGDKVGLVSRCTRIDALLPWIGCLDDGYALDCRLGTAPVHAAGLEF